MKAQTVAKAEQVTRVVTGEGSTKDYIETAFNILVPHVKSALDYVQAKVEQINTISDGGETGYFAAGQLTNEVAITIISEGAARSTTGAKVSTTTKSPSTQQKLITSGSKGNQKRLTDGGKSKQKLLTDGSNNAFNIAKNGGRHGGFYKNNLTLSKKQLQKGINKIQRQIDEHTALIKNPQEMMKKLNKGDFKSLDPREQKALLEKKWPGDIQRQREQQNILKGILNEK